MSDHDTTTANGRPEPLTDLSDERVWSMLESAPDGMILADGSGVILIVNRQVEELFGYDRGELLGMPVETLMPTRYHDAHRGHRGRYQIEPSVRAMGAALDLWGCRRDGSEFPVEISLSPIDDDSGSATIVSIRDVSDRMEVERRVEASERAFRTAFESAPVGMVTIRVDEHGQRLVERVNRSFCDMLRCEPGDLIGVELATLTHPHDEAADRAAAADMATGRGMRFEAEQRYRRSDGSYVWALAHSTVLDPGDDQLVLRHVVDLTERRAAQTERARLDQLEDRERIGRDLHDVVIQRLFAAGMGLQSVVTHIAPADAVGRVQATIDELDTTIRELRSTIFGLTETADSPSIEDRCRAAVAAHEETLGFGPNLITVGELASIPLVVVEQLLPSLNEALSNVARHAASTIVDVSIEVTDEQVVLLVSDNGVGVSPDVVRGQGLNNLEARAGLLGGTCTLRDGAAGGTSLTWTAPV